MAFPSREYFRLHSLQNLWGVSQEDIFYAIENGLLRACIWLPLRFVERGVIRDRKFIYVAHEPKEGYVGVRPEDCRRICSTGRARLRIFNSICEKGHILRLAYEPPQPAISVRINDLIVLKEDKEKFERSYHLEDVNEKDNSPDNPDSGFYDAFFTGWVIGPLCLLVVSWSSTAPSGGFC